MDSSNEATIRHSGRALIRGKIRRVWRPRYLELCDSGLVKYYELNDVDARNSVELQQHEQPKCTLVIFHARIIDITTFRDMHVGLPMGSYGFVFHGQRRPIIQHTVDCHPPEHYETRDFLCAVNTLEEAQSWVVALQWAASEKRREDEWQEEDEDFYAGSVGRQRTDNAFQVLSTKRQAPKREKKQGKTVVTQVSSLQLVRVGAWRFELAYSIRILLLQQTTATTTTTTTTSTTTAPGLLVEERTIARTLNDIRTMLQELQQEVTNPQSLQVIQKCELPLELTICSDYVASLLRMDQALRSLAMDAHVCNSQSMRSFLSLSVETPTSSSSVWKQLQLHDPTGLVEIKQLPTPQNTREFVQSWLQNDFKKRHHTELAFRCMTAIVWLLKRPLPVVGGLAASVLLVPIALTVYQRCVVSIEVRMDVLIVTWAASVFIGREYERRECKAKLAIIPALLSSRKKVPSTDSMETDGTMVDDGLLEVQSVTSEEEVDLLDEEAQEPKGRILSSPLPEYPCNGGESCWSRPENDIFRVRGATYLHDRIKIPSAPAPFVCRGVDIWLTDNPERHIARHPGVLGGRLGDADTFVVNFLLPFGNFVAYFAIPSLESFPPRLAHVWTKFLKGDQQYRDARLKLLPVVVDGPWIVRTAVGAGNSPALLGKVIPLQYYFKCPIDTQKGVYEVDVIITASRIAKGILNVVKGHTKMLTMAFAFIIEAAEEEELPETVLCTFQMHSIHLEDCPRLPECNLDDIETVSL
jgi:hypothetical protein